MRRLDLIISVTSVLAGMAVVASFLAAPAANAAHARPGTCGEYMYWHHGHCVDARLNGGEPWTETMAKKKATW
jgi:hypothetical protein